MPALILLAAELLHGRRTRLDGFGLIIEHFLTIRYPGSGGEPRYIASDKEARMGGKKISVGTWGYIWGDYSDKPIAFTPHLEPNTEEKRAELKTASGKGPIILGHEFTGDVRDDPLKVQVIP
jgi:hypothetical protein